MSSRSPDVTRRASPSRRATGLQSGLVPAPPWFTSLPVVQQPFYQSPADPARWRSAVPPSYQLVSSPSAPRARPKSTHHRHSRSSLQCPRSCDLRPGLEPLSSSLATDRRPRGARVSDVKRGKLPGHPALPDERVRTVRAGHRGQCQAQDPQGGRLLRGARRDPVLPAAAAAPQDLRGAGGGAAARAALGAHRGGAPGPGRHSPHPASDLARLVQDVLVARYIKASQRLH